MGASNRYIHHHYPNPRIPFHISEGRSDTLYNISIPGGYIIPFTYLFVPFRQGIGSPLAHVSFVCVFVCSLVSGHTKDALYFQRGGMSCLALQVVERYVMPRKRDTVIRECFDITTS